MIVLLDPSIFDPTLPRNKVVRALDLIFDAAFRGEHYVFAEREVLTSVQGMVELSSASKIALERITKSIAQYGGLLNLIDVKVVVKGCLGDLFRKITDNEWELSLDDIIANGVHKPVLIAEDMVDAKLFKYAALQYAVSEKLFPRVCVELDPGGGSSIPDTLDNQLVSEGRWVLCITDSDREYPGASLSLTARRCKEIVDRAKGVSEYVDIECRESENIVPLSFIEPLIDPQKSSFWSNHRQRVEIQSSDWHKYCDLKEGLTLKKIFSFPDGTPRKNYWLRVASEFLGASAQCISNENCVPEKCGCHVTSGFGDRLLERIVDQFGMHNSHYFEKMARNDVNRYGWYSIGKKVYGWACAPAQIRC
jgi:hypothetical protein